MPIAENRPPAFIFERLRSLTRSRALPGNAWGEALPHTLPEAVNG